MPDFDASVDLTHLPLGMAAADAVARVREDFGALPGAKWISVEAHVGVPHRGRWVSIYKAGDSRSRDGYPWDDLAARIASTATAALTATI
jgi:hypothetical protein